MANQVVRNILLPVFLLVCVIGIVTAPPPPTRETPAPENVPEGNQEQNTGLYYDEYLQMVVKLLESDENFRKTMETADFEDIKNGKLSDELHKIPTHIREKLDAAKKDEISRLRRILRAKMDSERGRRIPNSGKLKEIAEHLDSSNVHTFEAQDLTNLIKAASKDLENFDEKRHKDFKNYEMMKDMRRMEKLKKLNSEEKKKAEEEYKAMREKHENHAKVNHPGSKAQLDEVWKETDGLADEKFDAKTFFIMHDINGDGVLDPIELEALFETELRKVYDNKNPEDDMVEMEEERRRMREHVTNEVDKNRDGVVSMEEFLRYTKLPEFENPDADSYKSVDEMIDENDIYSEEDLKEFRLMVEEHENDLKTKLEELNKKADSVKDMKTDLVEHEKIVGPNPPEHEQDILNSKKKQIEQEEESLRDMKEEVDEHREELADMKNELKEQEDAAKQQEMAIKIDDDQNQVQDVQDLNKLPHDDGPLEMQKDTVHEARNTE